MKVAPPAQKTRKIVRMMSIYMHACMHACICSSYERFYASFVLAEQLSSLTCCWVTCHIHTLTVDTSYIFNLESNHSNGHSIRLCATVDDDRIRYDQGRVLLAAHGSTFHCSTNWMKSARFANLTTGSAAPLERCCCSLFDDRR
mmetsp:Transcript_32044/g.52943  ORF Transcript_32044/g.52943 Transcript_32044/m.52943 type:complete len:144 (-) Transcript_32044:128-559(-)